MRSAKLRALEQALSYEFKNLELMVEALTHRSHHHEYGDSSHNERLEFLGDAVLYLCSTELLVERYPQADEGALSKIRSQLVSENLLAQLGRRLELGELVRLGRGEDSSGGRARQALLADTMEAVLAAIYLDGGFAAARRVVRSLLEAALDTERFPTSMQNGTLLGRDAKSRLQELCQGLRVGTPIYRCLGSDGPQHSRHFLMAVCLGDVELAQATGRTKKDATQSAAALVLEAAGAQLGESQSESNLQQHLLKLGCTQEKPNEKPSDIEAKTNANAEGVSI